MLKLNVNGKEYELEVMPHETLADILRDKIGLSGVRHSCGKGECGGCTVLMENKPVPSCLVLAVQAEGKEIITIEGIGSYEELHPIQEAFVEEHGMQCGFCTPGVILTAKALLKENPAPTPLEVAEAINGHICRCGNYPSIIKSIIKAGEKIKGGTKCER